MPLGAPAAQDAPCPRNGRDQDGRRRSCGRTNRCAGGRHPEMAGSRCPCQSRARVGGPGRWRHCRRSPCSPRYHCDRDRRRRRNGRQMACLPSLPIRLTEARRTSGARCGYPGCQCRGPDELRPGLRSDPSEGHHQVHGRSGRAPSGRATRARPAQFSADLRIRLRPAHHRRSWPAVRRAWHRHR
jgi:hypothetical protein